MENNSGHMRLYSCAIYDTGASQGRGMRAAVYNSHMLPMGGSERVTLEAIDALINRGCDVDLYLLAGFKASDLTNGFGRHVNLRCRVRITKVPGFRQSAYGPRRGGGYLDLARSVLDKRVGECDIFIDMVPFLSSHFAPYLRLPDVAYWNLLPSDLGWMRNKNSVLERLYLVPLRTIARTFVNRWKQIPLHIANSEFTKEAVIERLSRDLHPIVIYPPVDLPVWFEGSDVAHGRSGVASLGRFETWKRHDLQLKIAHKTRTTLRMIGRAVRYDELACLSRLKQAAKGNLVEFHVNVSQKEAKRILMISKVFLHTADSEPFGISIVEAISAGCVPIVRNGGGTSEIVPYQELRFDTLAEAEEKIRMALNGDYDNLVNKLRDHVRIFDREKFQKRLADSVLGISKTAANLSATRQFRQS